MERQRSLDEASRAKAEEEARIAAIKAEEEERIRAREEKKARLLKKKAELNAKQQEADSDIAAKYVAEREKLLKEEQEHRRNIMLQRLQ